MYGREHMEQIERSGGVAPVPWPTRFQTPGSVSLERVTTGAQLFAEDGLARVSVSLSRDSLREIVQRGVEILATGSIHEGG